MLPRGKFLLFFLVVVLGSCYLLYLFYVTGGSTAHFQRKFVLRSENITIKFAKKGKKISNDHYEYHTINNSIINNNSTNGNWTNRNANYNEGSTIFTSFKYYFNNYSSNKNNSRNHNTFEYESTIHNYNKMNSSTQNRPENHSTSKSFDQRKYIGQFPVDFPEEGWRNYHFNKHLSDMMSMHRHLPDVRERTCFLDPAYYEKLPSTSVIIVFFNEAWSTLLRTVHSVIDRSPSELIHEIILVDDFSNIPELKSPLENYFSDYPKVKIIKLNKHEGLIRAKMRGAEIAEAKILTFLDAHCECTKGWLEPLLHGVAKSRTTVRHPIIDKIDVETFQYSASDSWIAGFYWTLEFFYDVIPEREKNLRESNSDPYASPLMIGGIFSIDKSYFKELGMYDSGLEIWGSENFELSFKVWMCGGRIEFSPCSHVGHILRTHTDYKTGNHIISNSVRVAEVWMDDYAKYFFRRIDYKKGNYGNITVQKEIRRSLNCKTFDWYLQNVYPELSNPKNCLYDGRIKNIATTYCLHTPGRWENTWELSLKECDQPARSQFWMLKKSGVIQLEEKCLLYKSYTLELTNCDELQRDQIWGYNRETNRITHLLSGMCLTSYFNEGLEMSQCQENDEKQMWIIQYYYLNQTAYLLWDDEIQYIK